jgi:hypothetical protein
VLPSCPTCYCTWHVRCNADYCGLKCYQSKEHQGCSERFYKECVEAELTGENLSSESKEKMQQILQRMNREEQQEEEEDEDVDSDDDEDVGELEDRLAEVDLDDTEKVWSLLSKEEQRHFGEMLKSGELAGLVPEYKPWWKTKVEVKKIKEVGEPEVEEELRQKCPTVGENIPSLRTVCPNPSPYVKHGLLNLLYAYAYAVRYFGGEQAASGPELVEVVQLLAGTLEGRNFELADTAVETAASEVNNHSWLAVSLEHSRWVVLVQVMLFLLCMFRNVKKDVFDLVKGPTGEDNFYILAALSDLKAIFGATLKTLKNASKMKNNKDNKESELPVWMKTEQKKPDLQPAKVHRHLKKIEFYLSWSQDFYDVFKEL